MNEAEAQFLSETREQIRREGVAMITEEQLHAYMARPHVPNWAHATLTEGEFSGVVRQPHPDAVRMVFPCELVPGQVFRGGKNCDFLPDNAVSKK